MKRAYLADATIRRARSRVNVGGAGKNRHFSKNDLPVPSRMATLVGHD